MAPKPENHYQSLGVGIAPEGLGRVFDRFHRIEGSSGRTYEGTGIGLALVQELAKLHGGSVRVTSTVGEGTSFTVLVRLGTQHIPEERLASLRPASSSSRANPLVEEALRWIPDDESAANSSISDARQRIILADDNADMREYVTRLLSNHYSVTAVPDGLAALAAALESPPDLILSDVMMPGLDGF